MEFTLDVAQNIITIAKYVLGQNMLQYVQNLANNIKKPNNKEGCGCICGMKSLYQFILQADYRQDEMINEPDYQVLIAQIFKCVSMTPAYYTWMGGGNVINATITPPSGSGTDKSYAEFTIPLVPDEGTTVIPTLSSDQSALVGCSITSITREGLAMQSKYSDRSGYYTFDPSVGQATIAEAANGDELFIITYKKLVNVS